MRSRRSDAALDDAADPSAPRGHRHVGVRVVVRALVGSLVALAPSVARAGNDEGVLIGNEAAISGGAVTSIVGDGTAAWYNPAGLALVEENQVDVSASATELRIASTPRLLQSASGLAADGGYYELNGIPAAVTASRHLDPRLVVSLGLFVPSLVGHTDRVGLVEMGESATTRWQLVQQENVQRYYGGVSLGYALSPTLRVGVTLFGLYRQQTTVSQFFGGTEDDGGFVTGASSLASLQTAGLELGAGLQWEALPGLHLGIAIRTPALQLGSLYRQTETELAASPSGIYFAPTDSSGLVPKVELVTPMRLRLGIAHRFARGWVGFDADISHELHLPEFGIDRRWVVNTRFGVRYEIEDNVWIGGGLFTDFSSAAHQVESFGETIIDFYGGSLGIEMRTPHALGSDERASRLVFSQTFALRYALGVGSIGGLRFDTSQAIADQVSVVATDTVVHELSLYVGSGLYF